MPTRKSTTAAQSVTDLYKLFEAAHAAYKAIPDSEEAGKKGWERALNKADCLANLIAKAPAYNVTEMLLKIRVAAWNIGDTKYKRLEDLDRWKPGLFSNGAEYETLASLRGDLRRLCRSGSIALTESYK
jgi:hypothetical protein